MFRFFEGLVDPYGPYEQTDTPPRRLWPFLKDYIRPFRMVFSITAALSVVTAFADVALIWYVGRLVDLLGAAEQSRGWDGLIEGHGVELALMLASVLVFRSLIVALSA